jgi:hypothetical protein
MVNPVIRRETDAKREYPDASIELYRDIRQDGSVEKCLQCGADGDSICTSIDDDVYYHLVNLTNKLPL